MASKSPQFYKDKWFKYYKDKAESKGLVFTERQFKRVEYGFCMDEWAKDNRKDLSSLNSHFHWHYSDAIESLISSSRPSFFDLIKPAKFIGKEYVQPVKFGEPIKGPGHAWKWRNYDEEDSSK